MMIDPENEEAFLIPIDDKIKEFKIHLDSHPRTIFSAKYGDGKSFFIDKAIEYISKEHDYVFLKIYPINYQVLENKDIFEMVKHDILYQMLLNNMIESDYDVDENVAMSFFLQNNINSVFEYFFDYLQILNSDSQVIKSALLGYQTIKVFKTFRNAYLKYKKECSKDKYVCIFLDKVETNFSIEEDIITKVIKDNIKRCKKKVVIVFEDMDRIDPAHLFRIMNVLSAQIDYPYRLGMPTDESLIGNKFGVDNVVMVLDYRNLENIFHHFYGANTDFKGYVSKFSSRGYFKYSLKEVREKYIYDYFSQKTGLEISMVKFFIDSKVLSNYRLRNIKEACEDLDKQISPDCHYRGTKIICSHKILKMIIILQRLGCDNSHLFNNVDNIMKNHRKNFFKLFPAYILYQKKDFPYSLYLPGESTTDYWKIEYQKILEDGDAQIECVNIGGKCYNEMTTLRQMFETMFRLISQ